MELFPDFEMLVVLHGPPVAAPHKSAGGEEAIAEVSLDDLVGEFGFALQVFPPFLTSSSCHPRKISHPIFLNENAIFEQPLVWEYESAILLSFFRVTQGINQSVDYQTLISLLQKSDEVRKIQRFAGIWSYFLISKCW